MLELFKTDKYDNKIIVISDNKKYSVLDLKKLIAPYIEILKNKKENIVISTPDNFVFIVQFLASIFSFKNIYLISDKTKINNIDFDFDTIDDIELNKKEEFICPDIDIKKTIINFYTSGSSASPKIIKKSLYNLIQEGQDIALELNFENKDYQVISTTTMCHLFGMTFHFMFALCNGLIINTNKISYSENINFDNSILISTPAFLSPILKYNLSFIKAPKYIISAGSKLDNKVFEHLEKQSKIIEIYGSTETGVIAHKTHFADDFELFKNVEVKVNEDNVEVKSEYSYDKVCKINDRVEITNRILKFKSRSDRLFKIQDKRISALELENNLKNNILVDDCYILKTEEKAGCLCALSKEGQEFFLKNNIVELTKNLKQYLSKYSEIVPQKWKFIDEIPLNKTGKINKDLINHIFSVNLSLPLILNRKISQNSIIYKLFFYNQCNFFQGHFPDFKLLPGVAQLYIAKEFANAHFNLNLGEGQWKRIKFSNIIQPDNIVELKLEYSEKQVCFEYIKDDKKCSSGVFLCENIFKRAREQGLL